jgi:hypothetical protein
LHCSSPLTVFLAAFAAGILFWTSVSGRYEGDRLERSLRLPIGSRYLHVHHWLYCSVLLVMLHLACLSTPFTCGFLVGSVMQGLTYRDWSLLWYEKSQANLIYAKWRSGRLTVREIDA